MDYIFDRTVRFIQRCVRWKEHPSRDLILDELRKFKILLVMDDVSVASIVKFDLVNLLCRAFPNLTFLLPKEDHVMLPSFTNDSTQHLNSIIAWPYRIQPSGVFVQIDSPTTLSYDLAVVLGNSTYFSQISATETLFLNAKQWNTIRSYEEPQTVESNWNGFGGRLSAIIGGIEVIKSFIRKTGRQYPECFDDKTRWDSQSARSDTCSAFNLISDGASIQLPSLSTSVSIPNSLLISGGAITSAAFYYLTTMFNVSGAMTVVEPKPIDEPDLNRYLFTTLSDVGKSKVDIFKRHESRNLTISTHAVRFQEWYPSSQSSSSVVLAGVDHIQSRWDIGRMSFRYLINGATWMDSMTISVHDNDPAKACVGCLNTDPNDVEEFVPTYGPVSALAGLLMAIRWVLLATGPRKEDSVLRTLYVRGFHPRLKGNLDWSTRTPDPNCPLGGHQ